jgi:DNA-3-methyladenine glycosylase
MVNKMREMLRLDLHGAARALLGWELVSGGLRARIVETEAYHESEPGCHAFGRVTPRCQTMVAAPGTAYVYFTYGNHWMLNVVAGEKGEAAAILIRAAIPLSGQELMYKRRPKARRDEDLLSGPGKLAAAFGLSGEDDGTDLLDGRGLHLVAGPPPPEILCGKRIGLAKGKGDELPWRYVSWVDRNWVSALKPPASREKFANCESTGLWRFSPSAE